MTSERTDFTITLLPGKHYSVSRPSLTFRWMLHQQSMPTADVTHIKHTP
jgi:hypothetical protein